MKTPVYILIIIILCVSCNRHTILTGQKGSLLPLYLQKKYVGQTKANSLAIDTVNTIVVRELIVTSVLKNGTEANYAVCKNKLYVISAENSIEIWDTLDFPRGYAYYQYGVSKKQAKIAYEAYKKHNNEKTMRFHEYFYARYGNKNGGKTFYDYSIPNANAKMTHLCVAFQCRMVVVVLRNFEENKGMENREYVRSGYYIGEYDNDCWNASENAFYGKKVAFRTSVEDVSLLTTTQEKLLGLQKSKYITMFQVF